MMTRDIRLGVLSFAALGRAMLAGCGQAQSTPRPPTHPAGTIVGLVESYRSGDKSHLSPAGRVTVVAYRRAFPFIGPVLVNGPPSVA